MSRKKAGVKRIVDVRPGRVTVEGENGLKYRYASLPEALKALAADLGGEDTPEAEMGLYGASQRRREGSVEEFLADLFDEVERTQQMDESELLAERITAAALGVDRHELTEEMWNGELPLEGVRRAFEAVVCLYVGARDGDVIQAIGELTNALVPTARAAGQVMAERAEEERW